MKQPPQDGMAISESLYSFEDGNETDSNIATPPQNCNLYGRPSIIPGIDYPISDEEERMLDTVWNYACNLKSRGLL